MAPNYRSLVPGGYFSSTPFDRSTPVSIRCNNPGAVNGAPWESLYPGYVGTVETTPGNHTTIFEAPEYGAAVWWELLHRYAEGKITTIGGVIRQYGGGQDYSSYLKSVIRQTGFSEETNIALDDDAFLLNFGKAMFHVEAGKATPLSDKQIVFGLQLGRVGGDVNKMGAALFSSMRAVANMPLIVSIAQKEYDKYHDINEGAEPLRSRIADYYEAGGGSRNLDPTLDENAWSAAFVSFCVKQSGASAAQFAFNLSHSVYVHAAIANADANKGVFRGHPITDYAPKLGDIVHHNRSGGSLSFEFARQHTGYPSHAAIVVGFQESGGRRQAVTIGGNEYLAGGTGTVGQKRFALNDGGFLDQSNIGPKLICVIENQLASGVSIPQAPGPYVVTVGSDLNLRGGPGTGFPIIQSLDNGTRLNVLQFVENDSGRWALVDLKGTGSKDGYVFAKFLEPATV